MKRFIIFLFAVLIFTAPKGNTTDLEIGAPIFYIENDGKPKEAIVQFTVSWRNAWSNSRNHDAAWLFAKFIHQAGWYAHAQLHATSFHAENIGTNPAPLELEISADGRGAMLILNNSFRGDVEALVTLQIDTAMFENFNPFDADIRVYGVEMVYIPDGSFYLGDAGDLAQNFGAYYQSDENGNKKDVYRIHSEKQIVEVGATDGALYYQVERDIYQGDQKGPVPAEFPKGVDAFYVMKYELTQGQYADFLNSLYYYQSQFRANFGGKNYDARRGTIKISENKYYAESPDRPCNFYSWDDAMAFADWACLRPMTEFEFTKAARGPGIPKDMEYPWGTHSKHEMLRRVNDEQEVRMLNNMDESEMTELNRHQFGASFYWAMDLAGSVWERVVSAGSDTGRAYIGSHGDGRLTQYGYATNEDWPTGNVEEEAGYGFRGGGYYVADRPYTIFNPYSPIAFRKFGAWSGGIRAEAYGGRFVRTVD